MKAKWIVVSAILTLPALCWARRPTSRSASSPPALVRMESEVVVGQRHVPEAFYVLQRSALSIEVPVPRKSFLPAIVRSVNRAPF